MLGARPTIFNVSKQAYFVLDTRNISDHVCQLFQEFINTWSELGLPLVPTDNTREGLPAKIISLQEMSKILVTGIVPDDRRRVFEKFIECRAVSAGSNVPFLLSDDALLIFIGCIIHHVEKMDPLPSIKRPLKKLGVAVVDSLMASCVDTEVFDKDVFYLAALWCIEESFKSYPDIVKKYGLTVTHHRSDVIDITQLSAIANLLNANPRPGSEDFAILIPVTRRIFNHFLHATANMLFPFAALQLRRMAVDPLFAQCLAAQDVRLTDSDSVKTRPQTALLLLNVLQDNMFELPKTDGLARLATKVARDAHGKRAKAVFNEGWSFLEGLLPAGLHTSVIEMLQDAMFDLSGLRHRPGIQAPRALLSSLPSEYESPSPTRPRAKLRSQPGKSTSKGSEPPIDIGTPVIRRLPTVAELSQESVSTLLAELQQGSASPASSGDDLHDDPGAICA